MKISYLQNFLLLPKAPVSMRSAAAVVKPLCKGGNRRLPRLQPPAVLRSWRQLQL